MIAAVRRSSGLPTSAAVELGGVARRTWHLRVALALGALLLLAGAYISSERLNARPTSYFASGSGGILVFDLSASVNRFKYQRVQRVLRSLSGTGSRVGLVLFSDTGYEALPPGTRGEELRPLLRFFVPSPPITSRAQARSVARSFGVESPWEGDYRGGTRISTGLREARQVILRDRIDEPSVLLMSDLDDSNFDTPALTQELIRYERLGIDLRVVPLFAAPEDQELFTQLIGPQAFFTHDELLSNTSVEEHQTLVGSFPAMLVALAAALLGLLALNERTLGRVRWRPAQ